MANNVKGGRETFRGGSLGQRQSQGPRCPRLFFGSFDRVSLSGNLERRVDMAALDVAAAVVSNDLPILEGFD